MTAPASVDRGVVSVVIATRNRAHRLRSLLDRLVSSSGRGRAEILVFDDASSDRTPAVCAEFGVAVRYLRSDANVGLLEARRRLIVAARGEFIAQLDDDSFFADPEAFAVIRATFERHPACVAIAANISGPATVRATPSEAGAPVEVSRFVGCGVVFRAEELRRLGSYPAYLPGGYGAEETALSLRILDAGRQILLVPRLRVVHDEDPGGRDLRARRMDSLRNELSLVLNSFPSLLVLPAVAGKVLSHMSWNLRHSVWPPLLSAGEILRATRAARQSRSPVSVRTIRRYYRLRRNSPGGDA